MGLFKFSSGVLEINMISAQDLALLAKNMKTYAVAWINNDPKRKLTTRVDQTNRANPIWNEKFVFKANDKILNDDTSAIIIEIYTAAWAKDALVGTVNVLLSDLFALWSGFDDGDGVGNGNNMRLVTLQIRRPSGRLQGFLRIGVSLLDGTQRSMPLSVELVDVDAISHQENGGYGGRSKDDMNCRRVGGGLLRRTHSDQTDLTTSTDDYGVRIGQIPGGRTGGGNVGNFWGADSAVNGSSFCNSDVGPSASVVAAAIAQGLYNRQKLQANKDVDAGGSILEGTTEGVKHKLDRWRNEKMTPSHDTNRRPNAANKETKGSSTRKRKGKGKQQRRKDGDDGVVDGGDGETRKKKLFSCFGNVFGCEIAISCGGRGGDGSIKKRHSNKVANLSAVDETYSQSAV